MKRYELKDKEKQQASEKLIPGFGRLLDEAYTSGRRMNESVYPCIRFPESELEQAETYNPKGWNNYPEVTPPECVLMQIEGRDDDDGAFHFSGYFKNRMWVDEYGYALATNTYTVERFRPWDEEKEA